MTLPTRDHILDSAAKVFAEHGFRGATTRRIAEAADVNEVTLFRLFGSKDALLGEAIRTRVYEHTVAQLPDQPGDARAELIAWAEVEYDNLVKHRASIRQGMTELLERPELRKCMAQGPRGGYGRLQKYLTALMATGRCANHVNVVHAAAMFLGALFADALGRDMMPEALPAAKDVPAAYVDLLLNTVAYSERAGTARPRSLVTRAKRHA